MTKADARKAVHSAFYRVVRQAKPSSLKVFFSAKVEKTMPKGKSPSGWPLFWWESVGVEINGAFMSRNLYILDFDGKWLFDNKTKTWGQVVDYIGKKMVPMNPLAG